MKSRAESLDSDLDLLRAAFSEISRLAAEVSTEPTEEEKKDWPSTDTCWFDWVLYAWCLKSMLENISRNSGWWKWFFFHCRIFVIGLMWAKRLYVMDWALSKDPWARGEERKSQIASKLSFWLLCTYRRVWRGIIRFLSKESRCWDGSL